MKRERPKGTPSETMPVSNACKEVIAATDPTTAGETNREAINQ